MPRPAHLLPATLLLAVLSGCLPAERPAPPPATITQGMAGALIDTGFFEEVTIARTIGRHHRPGDDTWQILACYEFTLKDGGQGANCIDSFGAFRLDNGIWVATVTVNGEYRWRALGVSPDGSTTPAR